VEFVAEIILNARDVMEFPTLERSWMFAMFAEVMVPPAWGATEFLTVGKN